MRIMAEVEQLIQALKDAGYEPRAYSGRGMYGESCVGVSTDNPQTVTLEVYDNWFNNGVGHKELKELYEALKDVRIDNLGLRYIAYWPQAKWPEGYGDDE